MAWIRAMIMRQILIIIVSNFEKYISKWINLHYQKHCHLEKDNRFQNKLEYSISSLLIGEHKQVIIVKFTCNLKIKHIIYYEWLTIQRMTLKGI